MNNLYFSKGKGTHIIIYICVTLMKNLTYIHFIINKNPQ